MVSQLLLALFVMVGTRITEVYLFPPVYQKANAVYRNFRTRQIERNHPKFKPDLRLLK